MASLIAFSRYLKALRKSRIFAIFVQEEQDVISITYNIAFVFLEWQHCFRIVHYYLEQTKNTAIE